MVAHRKLKGIKVFHTIFSSTVATSVAVASVIWLVLINPTPGYFPVDWLSDPSRGIGGALVGPVSYTTLTPPALSLGG